MLKLLDENSEYYELNKDSNVILKIIKSNVKKMHCY